MTVPENLMVRAVKTHQGDGIDVYAFFLHGSDLTRIADISRIHRDEKDVKGFQRKEIRSHVKAIVEFLDSGPVLFPNAITLAFSPDITFEVSRGPKPKGLTEVGVSGTLTIPFLKEGERVAWIVDGQQRSLALAKAKNSRFPVPVIGFVSRDVQVHREQFILVNKVKALDVRLINELLPEVGSLLPKDLAANRLPSELCNLLNRQQKSPFYRLIRRASDTGDEQSIVNDTALIAAIKQNLRPPFGALSQYKIPSEASNPDAMYEALILYWSAVRDGFPDAWGKPPTESRLMHSAGIRAMGALMDQIMLRADSSATPDTEVQEALLRIAPHCCWTEGTWEGLGWEWNEIQGTPQHISKLADHLMQLDRRLSRPTR
ncbi:MULTISPECIES: DGQHR domain-containing protein DpdB [Rhizobium]|uniref:DGQHR domain-containing protein DpdB n=1 Tax=Rhizobium TaxID=379 RepID=UPI00102FB13E|nr:MULTISPECIES: DGQHR domain-containing protein DpdB [Rhizobium]TAX30776.1 DGQHR domain-containing protein [Rhizobium leguminosarum]TBD43320.1 DGQHR domain-containing protein [Rhizobium ruizarguesonis]